MPQQTNRSYDFTDFLTNVQQGNETSTDTTGAARFLGDGETPKVKAADVDTAVTPGPPYYCGASTLCGFASVN